ncbi:AraC family transcriptional regulator [Vibrio methylphosphonaticus]|uniref:AraC family transcriptional regulator n=1 Tax=Vibrio methylphosphonaticus TaxID=2946866 RepID=UPI00202A5457|nr:AraC family transcriptional regulator [Vibrio methylphosphonaticus]MCL9776114.1 AraC family transcriptional regulator [Vibrio methylphosphonaticus]
MILTDEKHHFAVTLVKRLQAVLESERPSLVTILKRQLTEISFDESQLNLESAEQLVNHYNKYINGLYLKIYDRINLADFGLYGYAIASTATVRAGLALSQQFLSMTTTYYEESLVEDANHLTIVPNIDSQHPSAQILSEDFTAGYWVLLKQIIIGHREDMNGLILEFTYPAPPYYALYESFFAGCTLRFNQAITRIKLPVSWLNEPISLEHSKIDLLLSKPLIIELENNNKTLSDLEQSIYKMVISSHFTKTTLPDIAHEFSITTRQLRYYLHQSHASLRDTVLRARMSVASRLLVDTELDIGTIAETLNYSESSAFVRSFKSYYAISPLQYRLKKHDPFKQADSFG